MKMIKISLVAVTCFFFSITINSQAWADDGCAKLIEEKCTACHQLSRVCDKVGKKNESRWKRTIKRMVKRGTKLTKKENQTILACLSDEKEGVQKLCK